MSQDEFFTLDELSERTGEPADRLEEWRRLGLIGSEGVAGFGLNALSRVRLIRLCLRRGVTIDRLVEAERGGGRFLAEYAEAAFPPPTGELHTLGEASRLAGIDPALVERLREASHAWEPDEEFGAEEVELLRGIRLLLDAGIPEEAIVQGIRVTAEALGRVAENETRLFHHYVHERLRASGLAGRGLLQTTRSAQDRARPMLEPTILYFHRRGLSRAAREDAIVHLAEDVNEPHATPGTLRVAVLFVDISSFTPLAQAMGDSAAARVLERFGHVVRDVARHHDGRIVKQIGDEFMVVFPEPAYAVDAALDIEVRSLEESQFPAVRSGIHYGDVLYRDGDYVGSVVNIASRLIGQAQPHQVIVTSAVRMTADETGAVEYVSIGQRQLKGITEPLDLYEARCAGADKSLDNKVRDPVCGMELRPTEISARLSIEGREVAFCSEQCLKNFVTAPTRYGG